MNWTYWRNFLFIDTRFKFIGKLPKSGCLLDIGSSDGQTLSHFHEARPDLELNATDLLGSPEAYPAGTNFFRGDITADTLPWNDQSFDGITCMHLVEHLNDFSHLLNESFRVLKNGASIYIETPHPKTVELSKSNNAMPGKFTYNFWDDPTHVQVVPLDKLALSASSIGFTVEKMGVSKNLLFAALYPFSFLLGPRKRMICKVHFIGWSVYIELKKTVNPSKASLN